MISHLEGLGIRVHNTAEMKAFLEKNGVEDIEQYVKDLKEMEAIKQKTIADGTFMKATNGKPTNLTERQWLQVRTTNFKNWFGDWENDPANASKVVDENGEPLVVYHGGATDIHVFHPGTEEENTTGYGTYKDHRTGEEILVDSAKTMFFSSNPFVGTSYATMHGILYFQKMERQIEDILFNSTKEDGIHFTKEQFENGIEDLYKFLTNAAEINPRFQALKDYIQKLKKEGKQVTKENEREEILKMLRELRSKIQDFTSEYLMNRSEWENVYSRAKEVIDTYNNPDGIERLLRGEIPETIQREWELYEKIQSQRKKEGLEEIDNYNELHLTLGKGRYYLIYDGKDLSIWNPEYTDPKVTDMTREELSKFLSEAKQANQIGIEALKDDVAYQTVKGKAQEYAVYLNIRKPLVHDYEGTHQGQGYKQSEKYSFGYVAARQVKKAIEEGNDGVVYKNLYDPYLADNYGVFNPNQIKSATANNGDFSLTNNDIEAFYGNPYISIYDNEEIEILRHDLFNKFKSKSSFGCVGRTANYWYLCDYFGDGDYKIREQIKIDGNEEYLNKIEKKLGKRTFRNTRGFIEWITTITDGKGQYNNGNVNVEIVRAATDSDVSMVGGKIQKGGDASPRGSDGYGTIHNEEYQVEKFVTPD